MDNYQVKYLKYKNKYINLLKKTGGSINQHKIDDSITIEPSLLNTKLSLRTVSQYSIDCGPGGSLSGKNIWLKSGDSKLKNYLFKVKSCGSDANDYYYLYIKEKTSDFDATFDDSITIEPSLLNTKLSLRTVSQYSIDCGPGGSLSGKNIWLKSGDSKLKNYLFKVKSCGSDANDYYYLYIKEKTSDFDATF